MFKHTLYQFLIAFFFTCALAEETTSTVVNNESIGAVQNASVEMFLSGCDACERFGKCDQAFHHRPGHFCGRWTATNIFGIQSKPCCCPLNSICTNTNYRCTCHVLPPRRHHYTSSSVSGFIFWNLLTTIVFIACCAFCCCRGCRCCGRRRREYTLINDPAYPTAGYATNVYAAQPVYGYQASAPAYEAEYGTGSNVAAGLAGGAAGLVTGAVLGSALGHHHHEREAYDSYDIAGDSNTGGYFDGGYDIAGDSGDYGSGDIAGDY